MSEELPEDSQGKIVVFGAKRIRRTWHEEQWFFSVVDIVGALTDSPNPRDYWYRMKRREKESSGVELSTLCRQLKLTSADGKSYKTDCVNTEAAFRIIQSIPSPKAEPFKRWLAKVGYERPGTPPGPRPGLLETAWPKACHAERNAVESKHLAANVMLATTNLITADERRERCLGLTTKTRRN